MDKTVKNGECIEFTGGIGSHGYGVIWLNGKNQNAHKASYLLNVGDVPIGSWVLHKCDNKKCINPYHLYLGDRGQNTKDAVNRNRMASGVNHGTKTKPESFKRCNAVFSDEECVSIKQSQEPCTILAIKYNVNLATIYRAKYRADELLKQLEQ